MIFIKMFMLVTVVSGYNTQSTGPFKDEYTCHAELIKLKHLVPDIKGECLKIDYPVKAST